MSQGTRSSYSNKKGQHCKVTLLAIQSNFLSPSMRECFLCEGSLVWYKALKADLRLHKACESNTYPYGQEEDIDAFNDEHSMSADVEILAVNKQAEHGQCQAPTSQRRHTKSDDILVLKHNEITQTVKKNFQCMPFCSSLHAVTRQNFNANSIEDDGVSIIRQYYILPHTFFKVILTYNLQQVELSKSHYRLRIMRHTELLQGGSSRMQLTLIVETAPFSWCAATFESTCPADPKPIKMRPRLRLPTSCDSLKLSAIFYHSRHRFVDWLSSCMVLHSLSSFQIACKDCRILYCRAKEAEEHTGPSSMHRTCLTEVFWRCFKACISLFTYEEGLQNVIKKGLAQRPSIRNEIVTHQSTLIASNVVPSDVLSMPWTFIWGKAYA